MDHDLIGATQSASVALCYASPTHPSHEPPFAPPTIRYPRDLLYSTIYTHSRGRRVLGTSNPSMSLSLHVADPACTQQSTYPFLVQHIPKATSDNDEASSLSRQKRRRTSPQDHAFLEMAYQRNSKPDKNERIEIVSRVELGEKEVQVRRPATSISLIF